MLTAGLLATAATVFLVELVAVVLIRLGVYDRPNQRSAHQLDTLRGGGVGVFLGALVALIVHRSDLRSIALAALVVILAGLTVLGFADDVRGLSAKLRLVAQVAIASGGVIALAVGADSSVPLRIGGLAAAAFLIVAFVNACNFMDGLNGISAVNAMICGGGFAAMGAIVDLGWLQIMGVILAGAALGFLPHNFPVARIFLGDAGSYLLGGWVAIITVLAINDGVHPVAAVSPLWIYLADTGFTLVSRARAGADLFEAHREHRYQKLSEGVAGPMGAVAVVSTSSLVIVLLGLAMLSVPIIAQVGLFAMMLVITALYLASPRLLGT